MAVKKTEPKKTSTKSEPEPSPKAVPKKTDPRKSTKAAPAPAPAPKPAAPKAPAIKLSDAQTRVLSAVHQTKEAGYVGTKAEARILDALLGKKLIKKGKKTATGSYQFLMSKEGAKHVSAASGASSAPSPAPASTPAPEAAPSPSPVVPS